MIVSSNIPPFDNIGLLDGILTILLYLLDTRPEGEDLLSCLIIGMSVLIR